MITITYANAGDVYIPSSSGGTYSNALNGNNRSLESGDTLIVGQWYDGSFYRVYQSFFEFSYTAPSEALPVSGQFVLTSAGTAGTSITRNMYFLSRDWGTLDVNDWRTPSQIQSLLPSSAITWDSHRVGNGKAFGGLRLMDQADSSSTIRITAVSSRNHHQDTPTRDERNLFRSADYSGTASDPVFEVASVTEHLLNRSLGGQVQLSDGTHAYIEVGEVGKTLGNVLLKHHNGTSASTIATYNFSAQVEPSRGAQAFALCRDGSDNLFFIAPYSQSSNRLYIRVMKKSSGHNWNAGTSQIVNLPEDDAYAFITNIAAVWHSTGGANGTILVVAMRNWGKQEAGSCMDPYLLLNTQALLNNTSGIVRASGRSGDAGLVNWPNPIGHSNFINPTGTLLDIATSPSSGNRGYIISAERNQLNGENAAQSVARYVLNSNGNGFSDVDSMMTTNGAYSVKDPDAKSRIVAISDTRFLVGTVSSNSSQGITVTQYENIGTGSTFTKLSQVYLSNESITSMPSASTLSTSQAWDLFYNEIDNTAWVYYFDTANAQRLMRTQINLTTGLAVRNEVEVSAAVGAVGSENHAIRIHRDDTESRNLLISVANETSGGTHSMVYLTDYVNAIPTQPTLTIEPNFDADLATTLEWTFNDPDPGDTQSAFQLQIDNADTTVTAGNLDTGKLTGTITYVGAGTAATGNNASVSPALPTSLSAGDLMLCWASIRNSGTGTVNVPTGWTSFMNSGNVRLLGKIAKTNETAPTITFTGGAAGDDTIAQISAFRGTDQNINTVCSASAAQLNASAQNVSYPALTVSGNNQAIVVMGWKQDDWTSAATLAGMTEIGETSTTTGNDAAMVWDYVIQTTATNISAGSFTITGGASAISRGAVVALRPYQTPSTTSFTLAANTLINGEDYRWRVRTWDSEDDVSPWSNWSTFSTSNTGSVTILDPAADNDGTVMVADYTLEWQVTGSTPDEYQVVVTRVSDSVVLVDTGRVASSATTYEIIGMLSDTEYKVEVTVWESNVPSNTAVRYITPIYNAPEKPEISVTTNDDEGYILISITNPEPQGDRPNPDANDIYRREADSDGKYLLVGSCPPNSSFKDYSAASGVVYEYKVRAGVVS